MNVIATAKAKVDHATFLIQDESADAALAYLQKWYMNILTLDAGEAPLADRVAALDEIKRVKRAIQIGTTGLESALR